MKHKSQANNTVVTTYNMYYISSLYGKSITQKRTIITAFWRGIIGVKFVSIFGYFTYRLYFTWIYRGVSIE